MEDTQATQLVGVLIEIRDALNENNKEIKRIHDFIIKRDEVLMEEQTLRKAEHLGALEVQNLVSESMIKAAKRIQKDS